MGLGIAQVPEGRQIFGGLTVEDNLNLGGWLHGGGTAKERDDIYALFPILHESARCRPVAFPAASSRCSRLAAR